MSASQIDIALAKAMGLIPDDETPEQKAVRAERLAKMKALCDELVEKHGVQVMPPGPESLKLLRERIEAERHE